MKNSAAIDYLVCSVIEKMKHETLQTKLAHGSAESGASQAKRRRLADIPRDERPLCRFYLEGKCGKVSTEQLGEL